MKVIFSSRSLQVEIQVKKRKAQFRSSAVEIGKLSLAGKVEPFFMNVSKHYRKVVLQIQTEFL